MGDNVERPARRIQRRLRVPTSFLAVFAIILFLQYWILPQLFFNTSPSTVKLSQFHHDRLEAGLQKCAEVNAPPLSYPTTGRKNSRWNSLAGQNGTVVLRNVTLFDGDTIAKSSVDVVFSDGVITNVGSNLLIPYGADVFDLDGKWVTPGLVDMHSHHLVGNWPNLHATDDGNEMNDAFGPLTPFVRSLDSIKPYDVATTWIRSGGVTSSLILPGSANIMGGEAYIVKNVLRSGKDGEESVEEMLLDHGLPKSDRRRYMKMACGENPKAVYKHTRMGNAYIFRKHMERAVEMKTQQDAWCLSAAAARDSGNDAAIRALTAQKGGLPEQLELDSTVAILRGKVGVNIHCYEPEDMEDMLLHSKEFGFRIQSFHHALSAWKIPELLKDSGENITIATFSDFGFFKQEGYGANMYAGKILAEHGVPVAYKSDHAFEITNAKYLLFQAAMAHSFGLPEIKALQSVTSVPAKSLEQDHRIGYAKAGFDADLVVWDTHPLSVGATPLQVFVDGKATLDKKAVDESMSKVSSKDLQSIPQPRIRPLMDDASRSATCAAVTKSTDFMVTGIRTSYLAGFHADLETEDRNMTMIFKSGKVACFDTFRKCVSSNEILPTIHLSNGHALPGLIAITESLGLEEIYQEESTTDGPVSKSLDPTKPESIVHAKYGIHLEGRAFKRAQIGGVTRAVTTPLMESFLGGVSVGIKTSEKNTLLDGGIFQSEVGLHFIIGQRAKNTNSLSSISAEVAKLRQILKSGENMESVFGAARNGTIPLVIHTENKYDIQQMIMIKEDFPSLDLVIFGGAEAPSVADELAKAKIPVILTHYRGALDTWEKKDILPGPPLSRSPASVLSEAGVLFGLAIESFQGDSHLHNLALEASWVAKYAGLSEHAAVNLVSTNIERILGLNGEEKGDIVVWEGNPLQFGASVVVTIDGHDGAVLLE
ncbi:carbohydrate esterase family 9 protein-like protein [Venturia nashicola]|uniref:Carbohydrate esterase family 9 protein-like protein n=1 Tax=Venturia nashicola TaxID=86259 RepID=A0A4Z1NUV6_9PEZI|nr:carbohydrate esterase family 9 protein-like protein [Venturia nashicola]